MAMPKPVAFLAVMAQKKGLKSMKFNFLQKQTSRCEMLRGSAMLAGSAFLAYLFAARLLRASAAGYKQEAPSDSLANSSWTLSLRRSGPGSKRLSMAWGTRQ